MTSPRQHVHRQEDFNIRTIGEAKFATTLDCQTFVDDQVVSLDCTNPHDSVRLEKAGPRSKIYFNPKEQNIRAAIVSCGGLCPGINDVVRHIVMSLYWRYGVKDVIGLMYGYEGLNSKLSQRVELTPEVVKEIQNIGGSILGTSRGPQDVKEMVQFLIDNKINILFTIGGDGTLHGASEMADEAEKRGLKVSIVGVPKTIDNDILFTSRTFGFETAVELSQSAIKAAHTEAKSVRNGIGIVKLMGRDSGFIAMYASLASSDVNLCLIPEVPFTLEKVADYVAQRLTTRGHCLIVTAEGAGQDLMEGPISYDASGNRKLGDIGVYLRDHLASSLKKRNFTDFSIKYIDPSYIIRSSTCTSGDSIFCLHLAQCAVHAALTGRTAMLVGHVNGHFVHLPMKKVVESRKTVQVNDLIYQTLLDATGQPRTLV